MHWLHDLAPAPDATVLARCGEQPAIAMRRHGTGTVIAVALTTLGQETDAFWRTPAWREALFALLRGMVASP